MPDLLERIARLIAVQPEAAGALGGSEAAAWDGMAAWYRELVAK